jgi:hypothetical protein
MTASAGWWCPTCGHTQDAPVADQPDPEPPVTVTGRTVDEVMTSWRDGTSREDRCDDCLGPNPLSWWVDSDRWNIACTTFCGGLHLEARGLNPFLCPTCFIRRWEQATGLTTIWHLKADPEHIRAAGSDEWFAEHERQHPVGVPVGDDTPTPTEWCPPGCVYCEAIDAAGDDTTAPTVQWTVEFNSIINEAEDAEIQVYRTCGDSSHLAQRVADLLNRTGAAPDLTAGEVLNKVWLSLENVAASPRDVLLAVLDEEGPEGLIQAVLDAVAAPVREDTDHAL